MWDRPCSGLWGKEAIEGSDCCRNVHLQETNIPDRWGSGIQIVPWLDWEKWKAARS